MGKNKGEVTSHIFLAVEGVEYKLYNGLGFTSLRIWAVEGIYLAFPSSPDHWCVIVIKKLGCHAFRLRNFQTRHQLVECFSVYVEQLQDKKRTHAPIVNLAGMVSRGDRLSAHSFMSPCFSPLGPVKGVSTS